MIYYIFVFTISILCTYFAEISSKKVIFLFFSSIAVLLPAALAGVRDVGIGTDTITYSARVFKIIRDHNYTFAHFFKNVNDKDYQGMEFGYLLLNYIVSLFFDDLAWFHFIINLIVVFFFYLAAYDNRRKGSMWLTMTIFFFLFYNPSLNIMRQAIAVAMTVYAFKYIESGRWVRAGIWGIIIFSAHNSGIFFFVLIFINWISFLKNKKLSLTLQIAVVLATSLFFIYFNTVLSLLSAVSDHFTKYDTLYSNEKTRLTKGIIILYVCFLLVMLSAKRLSYSGKSRNLGYYIYSKILGIVFFLSSLLSVTSARIALYLNILDCIFIPRVLREISLKNRRNAVILTWLVVLVVVIIWYWSYIVNNGEETYPYKSKILGID